MESPYINTKRWNDPISINDGWRVLICRYRPRALKKSAETWDIWIKQLGPSVELHRQAYGKNGKPPISRELYKKRYLKEMSTQQNAALIKCLSKLVELDCKLTLLCSSACIDAEKCHRSLLKSLIEKNID